MKSSFKDYEKVDAIDAQEHEFALFIPQLSKQYKSSITLTEKDLITRIGSVLRLRPGDQCVLFDDIIHARARVQAISKQSVEMVVGQQEKNIILTPPMLMILPLLKRDDLAEAVHMLSACGVSAIQLVYTHKTQQKSWTDKDMARLERIVVAAAEQSKQFRLPKIYAPVPLSSIMSLSHISGSPSQKNICIFFDPTGEPLGLIVQKTQSTTYHSLIFIVGPEGDLVPTEKEFLRSHSVVFCRLTKTVLKASLAATIGVGVFRSLIQ